MKYTKKVALDWKQMALIGAPAVGAALLSDDDNRIPAIAMGLGGGIAAHHVFGGGGSAAKSVGHSSSKLPPMVAPSHASSVSVPQGFNPFTNIPHPETPAFQKHVDMTVHGEGITPSHPQYNLIRDDYAARLKHHFVEESNQRDIAARIAEKLKTAPPAAAAPAAAAPAAAAPVAAAPVAAAPVAQPPKTVPGATRKAPPPPPPPDGPIPTPGTPQFNKHIDALLASEGFTPTTPGYLQARKAHRQNLTTQHMKGLAANVSPEAAAVPQVTSAMPLLPMPGKKEFDGYVDSMLAAKNIKPGSRGYDQARKVAERVVSRMAMKRNAVT